MILPVVTGAETPILRTKATTVTSFDKNLKKTIKDMIDTMHAQKGIGIAAPQIDISQQIFIGIMGLNSENERITVFINPKIIAYSDTTDIKEEGCLSLPGKYANVKRSTKITIEFQTITGSKQTLNLSGMDARIAQHEYDHLQGILFIDRL
jgi:peptide deformylase